MGVHRHWLGLCGFAALAICGRHARADDGSGASRPNVAQASPLSHGSSSGPRVSRDNWWETQPPPPPNSTRTTLLAVGGAVTGLGALTMLAASITWLVSAGEALAINEEDCPNKVCYENSRGGRALVAARDAEQGAGIVAGIGMPLLATGVILTLFGAGMAEPSSAKSSAASSVTIAPTVSQELSGLVVEARF